MQVGWVHCLAPSMVDPRNKTLLTSPLCSFPWSFMDLTKSLAHSVCHAALRNLINDRHSCMAMLERWKVLDTSQSTSSTLNDLMCKAWPPPKMRRRQWNLNNAQVAGYLLCSLRVNAHVPPGPGSRLLIKLTRHAVRFDLLRSRCIDSVMRLQDFLWV